MNIWMTAAAFRLTIGAFDQSRAMSPFRSHRVALITGFLVATLHIGALAGATPASHAPMAEITSLADLPAQIRADLGEGDKDAISDRGGPFNASCVMVEGTPSQRFMLAALGRDKAIVAVEYGGFMHGASSREYRLADGQWKLVSSGATALALTGQRDLLEQHARNAQPVKRRQ